MISIVDTHAHLEQVMDVENALGRAQAAGVNAVIAVGMDLLSNQQALELAADHPRFVYPALGIHPWAIDEGRLEETLTFIQRHIGQCVAVGEVGLDYWIKKDKQLQREVFRSLLDIAAEADKPVSTHSRGSYEDVLALVKKHGIRRAVFHWYSGPLEIVEKIIESGYFISATPAVQYSEKHRAVIERVPLENLLLETDCPEKYHDVASEPAAVRVTLYEVAKLKGLDAEAVAEATTRNATRLFGLNSEA
jgi:TatD DNase family protein